MGWAERAADDAEREREEFAWLRENYDKHAAELAALRAILDGRTTPPTEAEIRAHASAGGGWLFAWDTAAGPTQEVAFHGLTVLEALAHAAELDSLSFALPLGPDRRPCAWPVTP